MSITVSSPGIYTVSVKNNQGCITNASIAVVYCVGMADFENIDFFNVYPNPFSNTIYLNISNKNVLGILKLYDAVGQLIIESPCEVKDLTFDTRHLRKGIYFLSFELESGKQISKKLIKE